MPAVVKVKVEVKRTEDWTIGLCTRLQGFNSSPLDLHIFILVAREAKERNLGWEESRLGEKSDQPIWVVSAIIGLDIFTFTLTSSHSKLFPPFPSFFRRLISCASCSPFPLPLPTYLPTFDRPALSSHSNSPSAGPLPSGSTTAQLLH